MLHPLILLGDGRVALLGRWIYGHARLRGGSIDHRPAELYRVLPQREDVIRENDHLMKFRNHLIEVL